MEHPRVADVVAAIAFLAEAGVDFIVIGGAAATLHGSPQGTLDLDIIRHRTPDNIARLLRVLDDLQAYTRLDRRRVHVDESHLEGDGALLLATRLGPLDLLGTLNDGRGYEELLPHTDLFEIAGHAVRVLDLPTLIEVKAAAGRDKDKLAVAHLLAILRRPAHQDGED
jgi:predicted nucleotidyltransferase